MIKRKLYSLAVLAVLISLGVSGTAHAYTFDQNDIIDDSVFNNFNSMNAGQIDTFLNGFPSSCISTNNGFSAPDPTGYNPTNGYLYGAPVSAGQVIYDAAQAYGLNPQVLLSTLQKEEGTVVGNGPYGCSALALSAVAGYACTDSDTASHTYTYTNGTDPGTLSTPLFYSHGTPVNSVTNTCVNSPLKAGFTEQVIRATWLLRFGEQRSHGNVSWAVIKGNWDNSDDPQSCYGGPTTAGTFAVCPSAAATYHDGLLTIDSTAVQVQSGATAALYWYTPHFPGNQSFYNIFTQWFGSTKSVPMPGCTVATNTTRSCIWFLTSPTGKPYYTSSVALRQDLVDNSVYDYQGIAFYGNVVPLTGNIPVYLLDSPAGDGFITASKAEYDGLVAIGYTGRGVDFYADPGNTNTGYPVFRLYSPTMQIHKWVASIADRDYLIAQGYNYEGVAFTSISTVRQEVAPPAGQELVYRFGNMAGSTHFWTEDVYERDQMIQAGYTYEGAAWRASQTSTSAPVYRLYNPALGSHLFTADAWEKSVLISTSGWQDEGIAWYGNPSNAGAPVYRLYNPKSYEHFFTTDAWEKSVLVNNGTFRAEGNAWYQP